MYPAIRHTRRAAEPGAGAALRRGDETTPDLPQEGGRTHAAQRPIASASLQAKLVRALTQTRARARQPFIRGEATHPAARHHAPCRALAPRRPNVAGAVRQPPSREAPHQSDEAEAPLQVSAEVGAGVPCEGGGATVRAGRLRRRRRRPTVRARHARARAGAGAGAAVLSLCAGGGATAVRGRGARRRGRGGTREWMII